MEKVLLIGMGGHAKSMIDCIEAQGKYQIAGYTDLRDKGVYRKYHYLGTDNELQEIYDRGVRKAVVALFGGGQKGLREKLYDKLKNIGYQLPIIQDPSSLVAKDAVVGEGVCIAKNTVINASSKIGKMCIINTGAIVEHEDEVGEFSHIAVGAVLCGGVKVGKGCFIGANATVLPGVEVGDYCTVGAGSTVLRNVKEGFTVYGIVR